MLIKKVFWVSLAFFLITLLFLGVYQFAYKHNASDPVADPKKKAELEAKEATEPVITQSLAFETFLRETVQFPGAARDGLYFYSPTDRSLKRANYKGDEVATVFRNLPGTVKRLLWSPVYIGALAQIERDGESLWYFLDLRNQSEVPLKPEMSRLAWNTLGDGIYYQFTDPKTGLRSLNQSRFDGTEWKKLADLGTNDHFIATIPQSSQVSFWKRPNGLEEGALESMSITGESRKTLVSGKFGGDFLWSPDGRSVLIGSVEARGSAKPMVAVADDTGSNYRDLKIPTLVNKMTWSRDSRTLYFAQPGAFPQDAILPNDYFGRPIHTKDTFWKMNLKTGKRERLVPLDEMSRGFDATELFLAPDESYLFFIERESGRLYRINL